MLIKKGKMHIVMATIRFDKWISSLTADYKPYTTKVSLQSHNYLMCSGFQTPMQERGV